ncbi:MAG: DUF2238 domain-containing protein [Polyangiaceae bacterium]|nr:DUF2238 domain-containing protein [Polyangiaceae bacterium]MCW5790105.1 DUF2238 domain-containing protein [Polyangiaceae bacterium]
MSQQSTSPSHATPERDISPGHHRLPLALLAALVVILSLSLIAPPAGRFSWLLEVGPGILGVGVLLGTYRKLPMSHLVYIGVFVHVLILTYGGIYTYAETPLGNWARDTFDLSRNHYDRVGHVALGVFPAFIIREVLLRLTPLQRGGWLYFLVVSVVLAIAAFWELLEWWVTLLVSPDTGDAFLGSQGDIWDAQWDMFLAQVGAMIVLPLFGRLHDRSMARVFTTKAHGDA